MVSQTHSPEPGADICSQLLRKAGTLEQPLSTADSHCHDHILFRGTISNSSHDIAHHLIPAGTEVRVRTDAAPDFRVNAGVPSRPPFRRAEVRDVQGPLPRPTSAHGQAPRSVGKYMKLSMQSSEEDHSRQIGLPATSAGDQAIAPARNTLTPFKTKHFNYFTSLHFLPISTPYRICSSQF